MAPGPWAEGGAPCCSGEAGLEEAAGVQAHAAHRRQRRETGRQTGRQTEILEKQRDLCIEEGNRAPVLQVKIFIARSPRHGSTAQLGCTRCVNPCSASVQIMRRCTDSRRGARCTSNVCCTSDVFRRGEVVQGPSSATPAVQAGMLSTYGAYVTEAYHISPPLSVTGLLITAFSMQMKFL